MRTVDPARHRAKRAHILGEAARLFAAHGFDGTTTAAICRATDMSPGNLFHYFTSKRHIFVALVVAERGETADRLATALANEDPWAGLRGFVDHLAAPATESLVPALVLEAMLQAHRDPEFADLLGRDAANEQAGLASLLTRAADAGRIAPGSDPEHVAEWVMAMIGGLYLSAATEMTFDTARQLDLFHRCIERFLRPATAG